MRRNKSFGEFVPEIERFLHKRVREAQNNNDMTEERTLKEYATLSTEEPHAIIVYPTVEGNNFEIKPALIYLVQQNQEAVRLHLFPFSLRDRASAWFHSLEVGSITSWNQMRRAFLTRFFPLSKTAQLRARLYQFAQKDGESLYDAWERFKEMLRICPIMV